jgi:hypothetical protein
VFGLGPATRIYLAAGVTDMRKACPRGPKNVHLRAQKVPRRTQAASRNYVPPPPPPVPQVHRPLPLPSNWIA